MSYIGNTPDQQSFTPAVDYFSGNGSTTAFTLSRPVASVAQVQVAIENVPQNPGSAFTVSGNTITFTSAPPSGTNNIYVYYTSPITQVIAPGQGTVGNTQMTTGAALANIGSGGLTPTYLAQPLTLSTAQASTSGTSIDFTGIPSWVKRITVMFTGVSTNGTSVIQLQLGAGSVDTTSTYLGYGTVVTNSVGVGGFGFTTGFLTNNSQTASDLWYGSVVFINITGNTWGVTSCLGNPGNSRAAYIGGSKALSGTLDRVRITTVNGTDTFDAGSINILYEG